MKFLYTSQGIVVRRILLVVFYTTVLLGRVTVVKAATVPTRSPNFGNLACTVCTGSSTDVITKPNVTISGGTLSFLPINQTCTEIQTNAEAANFRPFECAELSASTVPTLCGCSSEQQPAPAPIPAPVPVPVPVPVSAPIAIPTISRTTDAPVKGSTNVTAVQTNIWLGLDSVVDIMNTTTLIDSYNEIVTNFVQATVGPVSTDLYIFISATLVNQTLIQVESNSTADNSTTRQLDTTTAVANTTTASFINAIAQQRQQPQHDGLYPLITFMNVSCIVPVSSNVSDVALQENFTNVVLTAFETNMTDFISLLKTFDPIYFGAVESVQATDTPLVVPPTSPVAVPVSTSPIATPTTTVVTSPAPVPAPVTPPTASKDDSNGISGGAIAGIVIVLGAVVLLVVCCFLYRDTTTAKRGNDTIPTVPTIPTSASADENYDTDPRRRSTPPRTTTTNVAPTRASSLTRQSVRSSADVAASPEIPVETMAGTTTANETSTSTRRSMVSTSTAGMLTRTIVAPAGKLGIVIDTTLEGPVVHKVKDGSPLVGKLFVGDIITEIDGIDTRAMSASAITALMVKTGAVERNFTVLSSYKDIY